MEIEEGKGNMERLTTNKDASEMSMIELAHNSCYVKDGKVRYRDYDLDVDARALTRMLLKDHAGGDDAFTCDEDFDDWMVYYLQDGMNSIEGLIALFYRNLLAMADLRERLREYEDLMEQEKLLKDPQKLKDAILDRMKEFMEEYRSYSESSVDHFGGKADSMETAMRIVKAAFMDAMEI